METATTTPLENQTLAHLMNDDYISQADGEWAGKHSVAWSRYSFDGEPAKQGAFGTLCKKGLCWTDGNGPDDTLGFTDAGRAHIQSLIDGGVLVGGGDHVNDWRAV